MLQSMSSAFASPNDPNQHVSEAHLNRYLCEFDFRYSNRVKLGIDDTQRADLAIVGAKGKRLTYETTRSQWAAN